MGKKLGVEMSAVQNILCHTFGISTHTCIYQTYEYIQYDVYVKYVVRRGV